MKIKRKGTAVLLIAAMLIQLMIHGFHKPIIIANADGSTTLTIDGLSPNFADIAIRPSMPPVAGINVEPFSELKLTFGMNADGTLSVGVAAKVNDNYIAAVAEEYFMQAIPADIPTIGFSLTLDKQYFGLVQDGFSKDVNASGGEKIGEYTVTDSGSSYTLSLDMLPVIYSGQYHSITAGRTFSFEAAGGSVADSTAIFKLVDGRLVAEITPPAGPEPANPLEGNYTITKSASSVHGTEFSYTITAEAIAAGMTLNGMTISDTIPDGLTLRAVEIKHDGNLISTGEVYTDDFVYRVPDDGIKKVVIQIDVALSEASFTEYMKGSKKQFEFQNFCELTSDEYSDQPLKSNTVETDIEFPDFLNKEGSQVGFNGFRYQWTVKASTYFTSNANVYIIDHISDTSVHNYDKVTNITFNGSSYPVTEITPASPLAYGSLDRSNISYLDGLFSAAYGTESSKCVTYTYTDGSKTAAVMIVKFGSSDLNRQVSLSYFTEVNRTTGNGNEVINVAKIVWDKVFYGGYGDGIGWESWYGDAVIEKNGGTSNTNLLNKTAGAYNPLTQIMTWDFNLNRSGSALNNVNVIDTITKGEQEFVSGNIQVIRYDRSSGAWLEEKTVTPVLNGDGTELTLSIGNMTENDYFEFSIRTKVTNPAILTKQGETVGTQANSATVLADGVTNPADNAVSASKQLPNTLLLKECVAGYDYAANSITWKVTVNPNKLPISGGVLTDILPEGTEFGTLMSVTKNGSPIPLLSGDFTENHDNLQSGGKNVTTFTFNGSISDEYVFIYTTKYTDAYRLAQFKPGISVTALNTAILTGNFINNDSAANKAINITDTANHVFTPAPLTKAGTYYSYKGYVKHGYDDNRASYVEWNVVFNRNKADFSGVTITDELKKQFDLVTESMKVWEITGFNPDGTVKTVSDVSDSVKDWFTKLNASGFAFTIPAEADGTKAYLITFDTLIIEDASAAAMTNMIKLKYSGGESYDITSGEVTDVAEFKLSEYSSGLKAPYLQLYKTSSNTTYTAGLPDTILPGAEFKLTELVYNGTAWEQKGEPRVKTTDNVKPINFMMFKKNNATVKKTLYKLEETIAPGGYQELTEPIYFAFGTSPDNIPAEWDVEVFADNKVYIIKNEPNEGMTDIVFIKKSEEDIPLEGAAFTISRPGLETKTAVSGTDGKVTFEHVDPGTYTITETAAPSGFTKVTAFTAVVTKDSNGNSDFTLKDFTLTEFIKDSGGNYVVKNAFARGGVTITNRHADGSGNPINNTTVPGAVFQVFALDGTPIAYLTESTQGSGVYNKLSQTLSGYNAIADSIISDGALKGASRLSADGKLLLGQYYAVQITVPEGYGLVTDSGSPSQYAINLNSASGASTTAVSKWLSGKVSGKVVKVNGNGLSGVWVGLFPADADTFTEANIFSYTEQTGREPYTGVTPIAMVQTDANGNYEFTGIPYGSYQAAQVSGKPLPDYYEYNNFVYTDITLTSTQKEATGRNFIQVFQYRPVQLNLFAYNENLIGSGSDKRLIAGAQFEIYKDGTKVGYLNYNVVSQSYVVSNKDKDGANQVNVTVDGSKPYIIQMNDTNPVDSRFYLLEGSYTIIQKSTGTGYQIPVNADGDRIDEYSFIVEKSNVNTPQTMDVINIFMGGSISGNFKNDDDVLVSGAWVGIFKINETVFTEENLYLKIPVSGVTGGYVILDTTDVVRETTGVGFTFTNLPPGEYRIAEIVPKDGKYPLPSGLTYGGGFAGTDVTVDAPVANVGTIKSYSRYKEVELTLRAHNYITNSEVTVFTKPSFIVYSGTEEVAFLMKDASGKYILSDTAGGITLDKTNAEGLPYVENLVSKGVFRLLEGSYTLEQTEADDNYLAPLNVVGNPYRYSLTIPESGSKVTMTAENYQLFGSVNGLVVSKRDASPLTGVAVGIFPSGTTEFTEANLCKQISLGDGKYIPLSNYETKTLALGQYAFSDLPAGNYQVAVIADTAILSGYFADETAHSITVSTGSMNIDLNAAAFKPESMYQAVTLSLKALDLSSTSTDTTNPLPLEGSEFTIISASGKTVAYLINDGNGDYILSKASLFGGTELNEISSYGIPYLKEVSGALQLVAGSYNIMQTRLTAGYLDQMPAAGNTPVLYPFSLVMNPSGILAEIDYEIDNIWAGGSASGTAVNSKGDPLAGAWMGIFADGTTDFTQGNAIMPLQVTDSAGNFCFANLPLGNYIIAVVKAPTGYQNHTQEYAITVASEVPVIWQETIAFTASPSVGMGGGMGTGWDSVPSVETEDKKGALTIQLLGSESNTSGYSIKITGKDGSWIVAVEEDGTAVIQDIAHGDYSIELLDEHGGVALTKQIKINDAINNIVLHTRGEESAEEDEDIENSTDNGGTDTDAGKEDNIKTNPDQAEDSEDVQKNENSGLTEDAGKVNQNEQADGMGFNGNHNADINKTPKTGDISVSNHILVLTMLLSVLCMGIVVRRGKKNS